jgi:hypothetical protein
MKIELRDGMTAEDISAAHDADVDAVPHKGGFIGREDVEVGDCLAQKKSLSGS